MVIGVKKCEIGYINEIKFETLLFLFLQRDNDVVNDDDDDDDDDDDSCSSTVWGMW